MYMFQLFKLGAALVLAASLSGCITESASWVSEPLQPKANEPVSYLVGSIGPQSVKFPAADNQRIFFPQTRV